MVLDVLQPLTSNTACDIVQAFIGDDTWMQLFPKQLAEALPYPSFEVHDLHTVDDGVWQVS